jgi:hypothetical protein
MAPVAVVDPPSATYNAHDADRFARRPSDPGWAGELGAPATSTRGLAALGAQPRRAFAAMARPRAVEGEVVIDRERLDGLPGGPRDDVVVLRAVAGRIVRNWTASAAPRPGG